MAGQPGRSLVRRALLWLCAALLHTHTCTSTSPLDLMILPYELRLRLVSADLSTGLVVNGSLPVRLGLSDTSLTASPIGESLGSRMLAEGDVIETEVRVTISARTRGRVITVMDDAFPVSTRPPSRVALDALPPATLPPPVETIPISFTLPAECGQDDMLTFAAVVDPFVNLVESTRDNNRLETYVSVTELLPTIVTVIPEFSGSFIYDLPLRVGLRVTLDGPLPAGVRIEYGIGVYKANAVLPPAADSVSPSDGFTTALARVTAVGGVTLYTYELSVSTAAFVRDPAATQPRSEFVFVWLALPVANGTSATIPYDLVSVNISQVNGSRIVSAAANAPASPMTVVRVQMKSLMFDFRDMPDVLRLVNLATGKAAAASDASDTTARNIILGAGASLPESPLLPRSFVKKAFLSDDTWPSPYSIGSTVQAEVLTSTTQLLDVVPWLPQGVLGVLMNFTMTWRWESDALGVQSCTSAGASCPNSQICLGERLELWVNVAGAPFLWRTSPFSAPSDSECTTFTHKLPASVAESKALSLTLERSSRTSAAAFPFSRPFVLSNAVVAPVAMELKPPADTLTVRLFRWHAGLGDAVPAPDVFVPVVPLYWYIPRSIAFGTATPTATMSLPFTLLVRGAPEVASARGRIGASEANASPSRKFSLSLSFDIGRPLLDKAELALSGLSPFDEVRASLAMPLSPEYTLFGAGGVAATTCTQTTPPSCSWSRSWTFAANDMIPPLVSPRSWSDAWQQRFVDIPDEDLPAWNPPPNIAATLAQGITDGNTWDSTSMPWHTASGLSDPRRLGNLYDATVGVEEVWAVTSGIVVNSAISSPPSRSKRVLGRAFRIESSCATPATTYSVGASVFITAMPDAAVPKAGSFDPGTSRLHDSLLGHSDLQTSVAHVTRLEAPLTASDPRNTIADELIAREVRTDGDMARHYSIVAIARTMLAMAQTTSDDDVLTRTLRSLDAVDIVVAHVMAKAGVQPRGVVVSNTPAQVRTGGGLTADACPVSVAGTVSPPMFQPNGFDGWPAVTAVGVGAGVTEAYVNIVNKAQYDNTADFDVVDSASPQTDYTLIDHNAVLKSDGGAATAPNNLWNIHFRDGVCWNVSAPPPPDPSQGFSPVQSDRYTSGEGSPPLSVGNPPSRTGALMVAYVRSTGQASAGTCTLRFTSLPLATPPTLTTPTVTLKFRESTPPRILRISRALPGNMTLVWQLPPAAYSVSFTWSSTDAPCNNGPIGATGWVVESTPPTCKARRMFTAGDAILSRPVTANEACPPAISATDAPWNLAPGVAFSLPGPRNDSFSLGFLVEDAASVIQGFFDAIRKIDIEVTSGYPGSGQDSTQPTHQRVALDAVSLQHAAVVPHFNGLLTFVSDESSRLDGPRFYANHTYKFSRWTARAGAVPTQRTWSAPLTLSAAVWAASPGGRTHRLNAAEQPLLRSSGDIALLVMTAALPAAVFGQAATNALQDDVLHVYALAYSFSRAQWTTAAAMLSALPSAAGATSCNGAAMLAADAGSTTFPIVWTCTNVVTGVVQVHASAVLVDPTTLELTHGATATPGSELASYFTVFPEKWCIGAYSASLARTDFGLSAAWLSVDRIVVAEKAVARQRQRWGVTPDAVQPTATPWSIPRRTLTVLPVDSQRPLGISISQVAARSSCSSPLPPDDRPVRALRVLLSRMTDSATAADTSQMLTLALRPVLKLTSLEFSGLGVQPGSVNLGGYNYVTAGTEMFQALVRVNNTGHMRSGSAKVTIKASGTELSSSVVPEIPMGESVVVAVDVRVLDVLRVSNHHLFTAELTCEAPETSVNYPELQLMSCRDSDIELGSAGVIAGRPTSSVSSGTIDAPPCITSLHDPAVTPIDLSASPPSTAVTVNVLRQGLCSSASFDIRFETEAAKTHRESLLPAATLRTLDTAITPPSDSLPFSLVTYRTPSLPTSRWPSLVFRSSGRDARGGKGSSRTAHFGPQDPFPSQVSVPTLGVWLYIESGSLRVWRVGSELRVSLRVASIGDAPVTSVDFSKAQADIPRIDVEFMEITGSSSSERWTRASFSSSVSPSSGSVSCIDSAGRAIDHRTVLPTQPMEPAFQNAVISTQKYLLPGFVCGVDVVVSPSISWKDAAKHFVVRAKLPSSMAPAATQAVANLPQLSGTSDILLDATLQIPSTHATAVFTGFPDMSPTIKPAEETA